jgi:hypothetical protein
VSFSKIHSDIFSISSLVKIDHVTFSIYTIFCLGLYNKQNITRWLARYDFYLLVLKTIFYSLRSFVKYCFHHSKIKVVSSHRRVISSIYCYSNEFHSHLPFDRLWPNVSKALHAVYGIYKKRQSHESRAIFGIREWLMHIKSYKYRDFWAFARKNLKVFVKRLYTIPDLWHELFLWGLKLYIIFRYRNSHLQKLFKY